MDLTASDANAACQVPENLGLPGLRDICVAYPLRACGDELGAFPLGIAAAHKTVHVRESERGLLGLQI